MTANEEQRIVRFVVERLCHRFPAIPGNVVETAVATISATFRDARIHDFIPILVEREARDYLTHLAA